MTPGLAEETVAFARELARTPSLSGAEERLVEAVARRMAALGFREIRRLARGSLLGVVGADGGPHVLVDAHGDTVDVTSRDRWRHDPYGAEVEGGRLYGRGVCDVKGLIAGAVVGIGRLPAARLPGKVTLAITVGEEVFEGVGQEEAIAAGRPDCVLVVEPTELKLAVGHKGRANVLISTRGVPAHSSRPELGVNAVYKLLPVVDRLRAMPLPQDALLGGGVAELVEIVSSPFPGTSMVPDGCRARFDCRLVRGETPETVLRRFREAIGEADVEVGFHRIEWTWYTGAGFSADDFHPAWALEPDHWLVRAAQRALQQTGLSGETFLAPYCTNASYSAGALGIPTVVFGPGSVEQAHTIDEFVELDQLARGAAGYAALAETILGECRC